MNINHLKYYKKVLNFALLKNITKAICWKALCSAERLLDKSSIIIFKGDLVLHDESSENKSSTFCNIRKMRQHQNFSWRNRTNKFLVVWTEVNSTGFQTCKHRLKFNKIVKQIYHTNKIHHMSSLLGAENHNGIYRCRSHLPLNLHYCQRCNGRP